MHIENFNENLPIGIGSKIKFHKGDDLIEAEVVAIEGDIIKAENHPTPGGTLSFETTQAEVESVTFSRMAA